MNKYDSFDKSFFIKLNKLNNNLKDKKIIYMIDEDVEYLFKKNLSETIIKRSSFCKMHKITDKNIEKLLKNFLALLNIEVIKEIEINSIVSKIKGNLLLFETYVNIKGFFFLI